MARSTDGRTHGLTDDRIAGTLPPKLGMDLGERGTAARREQMVVVPTWRSDGTSTSMYRVYSQSGGSYRVFLDLGKCECDDHYYRDTKCKHLRRVALEVTHHDLPTGGESVGEYIMNRLQELRTAFKKCIRRCIFSTEQHLSFSTVDVAVARIRRFIDVISETIAEWQELDVGRDSD